MGLTAMAQLAHLRGWCTASCCDAFAVGSFFFATSAARRIFGETSCLASLSLTCSMVTTVSSVIWTAGAGGWTDERTKPMWVLSLGA